MIYTTNNKFKFRSPDHTDVDSVYFVEPDGDTYSGNNVDWSVTDSYGNTLRALTICQIFTVTTWRKLSVMMVMATKKEYQVPTEIYFSISKL